MKDLGKRSLAFCLVVLAAALLAGLFQTKLFAVFGINMGPVNKAVLANKGALATTSFATPSTASPARARPSRVPPPLEPASPASGSVKVGNGSLNSKNSKKNSKSSAQEAQSLTANEKKSVNAMIQVMAKFSGMRELPRDLVGDLYRLGLDPILSINSPDLVVNLSSQNTTSPADAGSMTLVRTGAGLPGTRYFHAQYFEDRDHRPLLQHLSFEVKPSAQSMQTVTESLRQQFKDLGPAHEESTDFVLWKTRDQRVVWIKKLSPDELAHDPFNAYGPEDAGSLRVAIELDIHAHENEN